MKNLWEKVKNFFSRIWHGLTVAGRIIFGVIILGIIALGIYAASDKDKDNNNDEGNNPEVAQVFEPSIGSPLPADTPGETGTVGGAATTEPSSATNSAQVTAETSNKVAPNAGIDPNAPVPYRNEILKFSATLPAGSYIDEQNTEIRFVSKTGQLLYLVSTNETGAQTLTDIEAQLRNSSSVTNLASTKFGKATALKFTPENYQNGIVFIANGKSYYLLGDNQYFPTFKTI